MKFWRPQSLSPTFQLLNSPTILPNMRFGLGASFVIAGLIQCVSGQFQVRYYLGVPESAACTGSSVRCPTTPAYFCCELRRLPALSPAAKVGSAGPPGIAVWTATDAFGSQC